MSYKSDASASRINKIRKYADGGVVSGQQKMAGMFDALSRYGRPPPAWYANPKMAIEGGIKPFVHPDEQRHYDSGSWTVRDKKQS